MSQGCKASYYTNPKWYAGFFVYCSGDFVLFLTLWYLPQAIVAVLGTWTLVANIFFAVFLLDEKLGRRDLIATALIFSGTTIAVYSYRSDESQYTASQLWTFLQEESFRVCPVHHHSPHSRSCVAYCRVYS